MSLPLTTGSWAPWWTAEQRQEFLDHVINVVTVRYGEHDVDDVAGTVTVDDCVMGLTNLAQKCSATHPDDWRLLIYEHVSRMDDFSPEQLSERLSDYSRVQEDLRIRVVSGQHLVPEIDPIGEPLPLGLTACLMLDLGGAACPVDRHYFNMWDMKQATVMDEALANTLADVSPSWHRAEVPVGSFWVLHADSLFTSAHLLDLQNSLAAAEPLGVVVTIPTAQVMLACPVELNEQFLADTAAMLALARMRWMEGPNSVSPNALWWRAGQPLEGFAELRDGGFKVVAPQELRDALE